MKLEGLEDAIINTAGGIVVAGDFNTRAVEGGMPHTDYRSKYILKMAVKTGLLVMNIGGKTTFQRPGISGVYQTYLLFRKIFTH